MLYTETDLEESMDKIETINFHEVKEVAGIKFWCYHAGHVLGAAMFMIEIAGVKVGVVQRRILMPLQNKHHMTTHNIVIYACCSLLQLLYTGDFSRQEDRHLMAAEIPSVKPDILITVSQSTGFYWVHDFVWSSSLRWCLLYSSPFVFCRSPRTAHTSMRKEKKERHVSVTRSMT